MAPSITEIKLLNQFDKQFYALIDIQLQYAVFLIIDGNIIPIFSDNNLLNIKIPLKEGQTEIVFKAKGLIWSITKKVAVPQKSTAAFKTMQFGRKGHIIDKRIPFHKIEPSMNLEEVAGLKSSEPKKLSCEVEIKLERTSIQVLVEDLNIRNSLAEIGIKNTTEEIESELNKHIIYEK
tara:strand:+ start:6922 stop:7455 length:534 start_codon:yes stop_codon:yes gene_type:complete